MAKTRAQLEREIREFTDQGRNVHGYGYRANRIAKVGFGTGAMSMLPVKNKPGSYGALHNPANRSRSEQAIHPELFACKDRNGKILGTSTTVRGAMAKAPNDKSYATVRGEFTSDGSHWGTGGGRVMATRESGRWIIG